MDCRTVSEPGTPASFSLSPIPQYDWLPAIPHSKASEPASDNNGNFNLSCPEPCSPAASPTLYSYLTSSSARASSSVSNYHNNNEPCVRASPSPVRSLTLANTTDPRSSGASRVRCLHDVHTSWQNLRFGFRSTELLRLGEQLSDSIRITSQYIQERPDIDTARHAVLVLAEDNHLYMPTHINDSTTLRMVLEYWLSLGYDINRKDSSGYTILQHECTLPYPDLAAYPGRAVYLSLLVEHGANVHSLHRCKDRGPLHLVMDAVTLELVSSYQIWEIEDTLVILINAGCDPYARDADGKTPFDYSYTFLYLFDDKWHNRHRELGNKVWESAMARTSNI
jgi:hypothetical protein